MSGFLRRIEKGVRTASHPRWWRVIARGVAPSLEHRHVAFAFPHRTVIDVGAGRGQFALFARHRFPDATVYALEPGGSSARTFARVHAGDPRVHLVRAAAGATRGETVLHVTRDADSSSTLALDQQAKVFPGSDEIRTEAVQVALLDDLLSPTWARPALLKIDVQGAELHVLLGAERTLQHVDEVFVEVSYLPLYQGQAHPAEVVAHLAARGLNLVAEYPSGRDSEGRFAQSDLLFARATLSQAPRG